METNTQWQQIQALDREIVVLKKELAKVTAANIINSDTSTLVEDIEKVTQFLKQKEVD